MTMIAKDPGTRIEFEFDWAAAYPDGQVVFASEWSVAPEEAEGVTAAAVAHGLTRTTVTLAGGVAGRVYRVTNRVTLSDGQVDERSATVRVEER
ncbi:MAG TPA: hypothetical protein PKC32_07290 [Sphingopyxis sp.]|nr:hypothetical protein [Sphingopyxis sp.]